MIIKKKHIPTMACGCEALSIGCGDDQVCKTGRCDKVCHKDNLCLSHYILKNKFPVPGFDTYTAEHNDGKAPDIGNYKNIDRDAATHFDTILKSLAELERELTRQIASLNQYNAKLETRKGGLKAVLETENAKLVNIQEQLVTRKSIAENTASNEPIIAELNARKAALVAKIESLTQLQNANNESLRENENRLISCYQSMDGITQQQVENTQKAVEILDRLDVWGDENNQEAKMPRAPPIAQPVVPNRSESAAVATPLPSVLRARAGSVSYPSRSAAKSPGRRATILGSTPRP